MSFAEVWLPNIVCGAVGLAIGTFVTHFYYLRANRQAEVSRRLQISMATHQAEGGELELARDANGEYTGGRVIRLATTSYAGSKGSATLTTGPSSVSGDGTTTGGHP